MLDARKANTTRVRRTWKAASLLGSLALTVFSSMAYATTYAPVAAADTTVIRVGAYDNPPKMTVDSRGNIGGFWSDITSAIAQMRGWQIEYRKCAWQECLELLKRGEIDVMPDVAWSQERERDFDFNDEALIVSWGVVYAPMGGSASTFFDLDEKRIAVTHNSVHHTGSAGLKSLLESTEIEFEIVEVESNEDVFRALEEGRADYGVVSKIFAAANEHSFDVSATDLFFNPVHLKYGISPLSPHARMLAEGIDSEIRKMKADPQSAYHQSLRRHIKPTVLEAPHSPKWLETVLTTAGMLFLVVTTYLVAEYRGRRRAERELADLKAERAGKPLS